MKRQMTILLALTLAAPLARAEDKATFKDETAKVSYALGMSLGGNWRVRGLETNQLILEDLMHGIRDAMAGTNTALTEQQAQETLNKFSQQMRAKAEEKRKVDAEKNKKAGEAFLAENKTKPGVVTLPSGLQYKVLKDGAGESPKATDRVSVHYRGTLIDGTEFDSSAKQGDKPAEFSVGRVIKGWTEALQLMKPGGKWQLFIPADLAYGDGGWRGVPPGATLIFDVELVSAQAAPPTPAAGQPVTSDIIKVPSAEEMKKGAKIETIKAEDVEKLMKQEQEKKEREKKEQEKK
jgi:FKBP-type peptidyl-prolyl cis-trans isomerase FklB